MWWRGATDHRGAAVQGKTESRIGDQSFDGIDTLMGTLHAAIQPCLI